MAPNLAGRPASLGIPIRPQMPSSSSNFSWDGRTDLLPRHRVDGARPRERTVIFVDVVELYLPCRHLHTGASALGVETGISVIRWPAVALYVVLLAAWVTAAVYTVRGSISRHLFLSPEQTKAAA
jgi:hypothetical protein